MQLLPVQKFKNQISKPNSFEIQASFHFLFIFNSILRNKKILLLILAIQEFTFYTLKETRRR